MEGVSVGRLRMECVVPRNHPNALAVRTRIDDASERLAAALGELLAPLEKLGDEVILIRKLELTFDLDTSLPPADLARAWAARLAEAVAAWLRPDARTSLVRFPDQAHWLACFVADAVSGRARDAWYHRRWRGLFALSTPAMIRSALLEEPRRGLQALAALPPAELTAVLTALGPAEARRIVEAVKVGTAEDFVAPARVLLPLMAAWRPVAAALPSPWMSGLLLLVRAVAALQEAELPAAAALAAALAALQAEKSQVRHFDASSAGRAAARLEGAGLPTPAPLLNLPAELRRQLAGDAAADIAEAPAEWYTRFGGLLLLLPRLDELPLREAFPDATDRACARLVLLARAAHRKEVLHDTLLRRVCGVGGDVDVAEWQPDTGALAAALWRRGLARARSLRLEAARKKLIVVSQPDGDWLALTPLTAPLRALFRLPPAEVDGIEIGARVQVSAARAAGRVLDWLAPDDDPTFALAAQQLLGAFARRLPGFADSSPRFLYDSFLDFDATVIESDGTFHCRMGRPRLAALFGLTGALRGRLLFGDGCALQMYPAG